MIVIIHMRPPMSREVPLGQLQVGRDKQNGYLARAIKQAPDSGCVTIRNPSEYLSKVPFNCVEYSIGWQRPLLL